MLRNLKAEMYRRNVTREKLAEALGVSVVTIGHKTAGRRPIKPAEKMMICNVLNMPYPESCEYLFTEDKHNG